MTMNFDAALNTIQSNILLFLRALEKAQQDILFQNMKPTLEQFSATVHESIESSEKLLSELNGKNKEEIHLITSLAKILLALGKAKDFFEKQSKWQDTGAAFLKSREMQCDALEILYANLQLFPIVEPYFRLPGNQALVDGMEVAGLEDKQLGICHRKKEHNHHDFSLYVPEYYKERDDGWPLIVALHGGYGQGREYLWSWLRFARSRGYLVLAPKSVGPTWSILQPSVDTNSILAMLDKVGAEYHLDPAAVFLSGLSDGGTFSYILGFTHPQKFAALSPVAGVLSPMTDPLLRSGNGKMLPLHVVHGALDTIFPIQSARSTNQLLEKLGYDLTYTELPDWGHALTYSVNENIVGPWFEQV